MIEIIIILAVLLIVPWLVFKLVKKAVTVILTVLLLILAISAGLLGIIYVDYSYYSGLEDFNLNVYYQNSEEAVGLKVPFENKEIQTDEVSSAPSIDPETLEVDKGELYLLIEKDFYREELLTSENYTVYELKDPDHNVSEKVVMTKEEIMKVLDSDSPGREIENILGENSRFLLENKNISPKEAVLMISIEHIRKQEETYGKILLGYNKGEINIYPERFSLTLLKKYVPAEYLESKLTG